MLNPLMENESDVHMEFEEQPKPGLMKQKTSVFDSVKTMFGK